MRPCSRSITWASRAPAAALKPYYPYGCKRPTFHDEYLPAFNLPHVHLVDTAPRGVCEINERGVIHEGVEYPLDVLIYATGFDGVPPPGPAIPVIAMPICDSTLLAEVKLPLLTPNTTLLLLIVRPFVVTPA